MAGKGILRIKVLGDDSQFKKTLNSSGSGLNAWAKKAAVAFAGLMIAKKAAEAITDAVKAGIAEKKTMDVLADTLKRTTGATDKQIAANEKWLSTMQDLAGFSDTEMRGAMGVLLSSTKDVTKAQDYLAIAMDIATQRGIELKTVTLALQKASDGQVAGLGRLGIAYKDASGNAMQFEDIMQEAAKTYGGAAAAAAETTAGKINRLKMAFGDIKEAIGMGFIPIIEKALPHLQALVKWAGELAGKFADVARREGLLKGFGMLLKEAMKGLASYLSKVDWGKVGKAVAGTIFEAIEAMGPVVIEVLPKIPNLLIGAAKGQLMGLWDVGRLIGDKIWGYLTAPDDLWGDDVVPFAGYAEAMAGVRVETKKQTEAMQELDEVTQGYSETLSGLYDSRFSVSAIWDEAEGSMQRYLAIFDQHVQSWAQFKENLTSVVQKYPEMFDEIMALVGQLGDKAPDFFAKLLTLDPETARRVLATAGITLNNNQDALTKELSLTAAGALKMQEFIDSMDATWDGAKIQEDWARAVELYNGWTNAGKVPGQKMGTAAKDSITTANVPASLAKDMLGHNWTSVGNTIGSRVRGGILTRIGGQMTLTVRARTPGGSYILDQGGFLPPGPSMVINKTGKPEPVLNPEQWSLFGRMVDALESGAQNEEVVKELRLTRKAYEDSQSRMLRLARSGAVN